MLSFRLNGTKLSGGRDANLDLLEGSNTENLTQSGRNKVCQQAKQSEHHLATWCLPGGKAFGKETLIYNHAFLWRLEEAK